MRPAYLGVLMSLWQEDVLRMAVLGRRAGLEPSTMTGLLDRMERDGLVTRNVDPRDRRAQQVRLTRRGRDVRAPVEAVVTAVMDRVFADIPGAELDRTKRLLRRVLGNLGLQEETGK